MQRLSFLMHCVRGTGRRQAGPERKQRGFRACLRVHETVLHYWVFLLTSSVSKATGQNSFYQLPTNKCGICRRTAACKSTLNHSGQRVNTCSFGPASLTFAKTPVRAETGLDPVSISSSSSASPSSSSDFTAARFTPPLRRTTWGSIKLSGT